MILVGDLNVHMQAAHGILNPIKCEGYHKSPIKEILLEITKENSVESYIYIYNLMYYISDSMY